MSYEIAKQFHFSASHMLLNMPPDHQCARLHGHNYVVEIILAADQLDDNGFVMDYGDLAPVKAFIDGKLDHGHICSTASEAWRMVQAAQDIYEVTNPAAELLHQRVYVLGAPTTAENLAKHIYEHCRAEDYPVVAIRVSETPKTWAEYRPQSTSG